MTTFIFFIRIYKAQKLDNNYVDPESQYLTFEKLDHMGLSKVKLISPIHIYSSCYPKKPFMTK